MSRAFSPAMTSASRASLSLAILSWTALITSKDLNSFLISPCRRSRCLFSKPLRCYCRIFSLSSLFLPSSSMMRIWMWRLNSYLLSRNDLYIVFIFLSAVISYISSSITLSFSFPIVVLTTNCLCLSSMTIEFRRSCTS